MKNTNMNTTSVEIGNVVRVYKNEFGDVSGFVVRKDNGVYVGYSCRVASVGPDLFVAEMAIKTNGFSEGILDE